MEKVKNIWVVASNPAAIAELTTGAAGLGEHVTLVYAGNKEDAVNAEKAYYAGPLGGENSFVSYVPAISKLIAANAPDAVLLDCSKNGRLAAGYISAVCGVGTQMDAGEVEVVDGVIKTSRMVFGGKAISTELGGKSAIICVSSGVMTAGESVSVADIETLDCEPVCGISFVEKNAAASASDVNLPAAKRIVGVGRGLSDESDLEMCRELAAKIGAEVGCTRPIVEEKHWMPKQTYIGVSGAMVKPEVYFAIGISGQVQHTVGINKSGVVIAIDKNDAAPIFKGCDYGIVGDLKKIVPALINLLD